MIFIEDRLVELLLCMSKIKRSLTASEGLRLANELIAGSEIQHRLILWKIKKNIYHSNPLEMGTVGPLYWNGFMKRNGDRIRCKKGRKYSNDRANYTNHLNFWDMYEHIAKILVEDSKIANTSGDEYYWVDRLGGLVGDEMEGFGCKTNIHIHRPDLGFVLDEVGCNLSQENGCHIGGQKFICGVKDEPYQTTSNKNHHFTCLGLTCLDGRPLMCVVIVAGKHYDTYVESGVDWDKLKTQNDYEFFKENFGGGKVFPGASYSTSFHNIY